MRLRAVTRVADRLGFTFEIAEEVLLEGETYTEMLVRTIDSADLRGVAALVGLASVSLYVMTRRGRWGRCSDRESRDRARTTLTAKRGKWRAARRASLASNARIPRADVPRTLAFAAFAAVRRTPVLKYH